MVESEESDDDEEFLSTHESCHMGKKPATRRGCSDGWLRIDLARRNETAIKIERSGSNDDDRTGEDDDDGR